MKKIIILSITLLLAAFTLTAGPAYPGRIVVTQPDGTEIGIWMHGDEFGHWVTDDAGRILKQDADGFWRVDESFTHDKLVELLEEAAESRAAANEQHRQEALKAPQNNFGSPRIPVILVGFSDLAFTKSAEEFNDMLNTEGYAENGAVGSVIDYFKENSFGRFTPQFEVLGPVQLDNTMAYYGENIVNASGNRVSDKYAELALVHAAQKLDAGGTDFSRYDNDQDGNVEFVIFYFAGFDEAQGGGSDCIWSHAWYLQSSDNVTAEQRTFDGVKLNRYFCTAELIGNSGSNLDSNMCHIGTTCHEFAHTLGLPDYYDTDYEQNGTAASMYYFDLMANGSYNANSTCPPYLNAEELNTIGWLDTIPSLTGTGAQSLHSVNFPGASAYSAYKLDTSNENEYFVFETRGGERWDAPLPAGLMVYHVDKSTNSVPGSSYTAADLWGRNRLNAYASHPCCYVVPALEPANTQVFSGSMADFFFPGTGNVRTYMPTAWSGQDTGIQLTNIDYANGITTFNLLNSNQLGISGCITDSNGDPLSGVTVSYSSVSAAQSAPLTVSKRGQEHQIQRRSFSSVTTDANGMYSILLDTPGDYMIVASKEGYQPKSSTVTVNRMVNCNLYLLREDENSLQELILYPDGSTFGNYSPNPEISIWNRMHANCYSSAFLSSHAGKQIKEVSFMLSRNATISDCHVFVDLGSERKCWISVDNVVDDQWITVNVSDQDIVIPANTDVYIGYAGDINSAYPMKGVNLGSQSKIAFFNDGVDETFTNWQYYYNGLVFAIKMTVGDYQIPDLGYNYIADPLLGAYSAGDTFNLTLVETAGARKPGTDVSWFLDDEPVSGTSVTLTAGSHLIEARFTTSEGKTKVVELELDVAP